MACITPYTITRNRDEWQTDKTDFTTVTRSVPCGKCPECKKKRSSDWTFRLKQQKKDSSNSIFLTLTYDNDHLPFISPCGEIAPTGINEVSELQEFIQIKDLQETLVKRDLQLFFKRLRNKTKNKLKYYAVGEYGSRTKRPHYHAILFNTPKQWNDTIRDNTFLNTWNKGHIRVDECNGATMRYVTQYIQKPQIYIQPNSAKEKEFSIMSKGIGLNHLTPGMIKYYKENFTKIITADGGSKQQLPRYFVDKIFNPYEKTLLAEITNQYMEENPKYKDSKQEVEHKKRVFKQEQMQLLIKRSKI